MDGREVGDVLIPFVECGAWSRAGDRMRVELPDFFLHPGAVRIEEVRPLVGVSGEVVLHDAVGRQRIDVGDGVEAVVYGAHVDVVHVEEHPAVGVSQEAREERGLGHRGGPELQVRRGVLEDERPFEQLGDLLHPTHDVAQRLLVVGQGQEVVRISPGYPREAEMVRDPSRIHAGGKRLDLFQVAEVERVDPPDRHRDAVEDDGVALGDAVEDVTGPAARVEEVLGDGLEKVHVRLLRKDVPEVDRAEPDPHAEVGQSEPVSHGKGFQPAFGAAAAGASFFLRGTWHPPLPLQAFVPAHLLSFVAQPPWPEQAFFPAHAWCMDAEAQPPLPLHAFWPEHELSFVLQAPWPLQAFLPAHTWSLLLSFAAGLSSARRVLPATMPATAAPRVVANWRRFMSASFRFLEPWI